MRANCITHAAGWGYQGYAKSPVRLQQGWGVAFHFGYQLIATPPQRDRSQKSRQQFSRSLGVSPE